MRRLLGALAALLFVCGPARADPAGAGPTPGNAGSQSEAAGCIYHASPLVPADGQQMTVACDSSGRIITGGSTPAPFAFTPVACTANTITTGGTAATFVTGPINGGYITNPPNLASQGIAAAENAYINPVSAPGSTDANGNGTTAIAQPGQTYALPALAAGVLVRVNAATSNHKLTCVVW